MSDATNPASNEPTHHQEPAAGAFLLPIDHPVALRRLAATATAEFRARGGTATVIVNTPRFESQVHQVTAARVKDGRLEAQIASQQAGGIPQGSRWHPVSISNAGYDLFDAHGARIQADRSASPAMQRELLVRSLVDTALNHPDYEYMSWSVLRQGDEATIRDLRSMAVETGCGKPSAAMLSQVLRELKGNHAIMGASSAISVFRAWAESPAAPFREVAPHAEAVRSLAPGQLVRVGGGLPETITAVLSRQPLGAVGIQRLDHPGLPSATPTATVLTAQRTPSDMVVVVADNASVTVPPPGTPPPMSDPLTRLGSASAGLPEDLHLVLEHTSGPVVAVIRRGEHGFRCRPDLTPADAMARNAADGVHQASAMAMQIGAVLGWGTPGADPDLWINADACRDLPSHLRLLVQSGITGPYADL